VVLVSDALFRNEYLLATMEMMVGDDVGLEAARIAFETTPGNFRAKFTAAVQARLAQSAAPEVFIEIPEFPDQLRKVELEALVRPAAVGFLRSYPSKDELLDQVASIRRRQQTLPAWIPRIDRGGIPLPVPGTEDEGEGEPDRLLVVSALSELGDITIMLPGAGWERPELAMATGGIGEWESALYTVLGLIGTPSPDVTIALDAGANEALVPDEVRWWTSEPPRSVSACQDPGVASELLATSAILGGLPVVDTTPQAFDAVADALGGSGDWRYSPRWLLEAWDPGDGVASLVTARAAIAGWADESLSGVIVYVYGGVLRADEGLVGVPGSLHSYLLAVTRSADGTDGVVTVHRVILSCPGEGWCHRGGCPDPGFPLAAPLLTQIVTAADTAGVAAGRGGWATESYQRLYGDVGEPECADSVLEQMTAMLSSAGWVELEQFTWEGGLGQSLLRRGEYCLEAVYDPVTRQIQLVDGKSELDAALQLLAEDGVLTESDGREILETSEAACERWGTELLAAADDLLHGRIKERPDLAEPIQATVLGLHPHADGTLVGPEAFTLADHQLGILLHTAGVLHSAGDLR
jgi:hypothetical protein